MSGDSMQAPASSIQASTCTAIGVLPCFKVARQQIMFVVQAMRDESHVHRIT